MAEFSSQTIKPSPEDEASTELNKINPHTIKNLMYLRILRSRQLKRRLLLTCNLFRSIQRRFTIDIHEVYSRNNKYDYNHIEIIPTAT